MLAIIVAFNIFFIYSIGQHFQAGGFAGLLISVVVVPKERIKCLMQVKGLLKT